MIVHSSVAPAVHAGPAEDAIAIAVSDTGIGIAPEDQAAIFEEFRQVGREDARKQEGTGLGLTLAKKFVELHGGRIWVQSHVGQGRGSASRCQSGPKAGVPATRTRARLQSNEQSPVSVRTLRRCCATGFEGASMTWFVWLGWDARVVPHARTWRRVSSMQGDMWQTIL
jgi:hypothetical protein